MAQVGPDDSEVTLDIYVRVLKRRDHNDIGRAFDHLLLCREESGPGGSEATSEQAKTPRLRRPEKAGISAEIGANPAEIEPKSGPNRRNTVICINAQAAQRRNPQLQGFLERS